MLPVSIANCTGVAEDGTVVGAIAAVAVAMAVGAWLPAATDTPTTVGAEI